MKPDPASASPLEIVAGHVATLGPVGVHSARPAAMASGLAASLYWFLPEQWLPRAAIVMLVTLVAELVARAAAAQIGDRTIVIDRWAGMWWALLPLRRDLILLAGAFALFRLIEGRRARPVRWVAARTGGPRGVADDVAAGLLVGLPLALLDRFLTFVA